MMNLKKYEDIVNVRLIAYTQPTIWTTDLNGSIDEELSNIIAYCARVSNPSNQDNKETNDRLIKYLIKQKHWSPFEMVNVVLEITSTRDIIRQILRHRSNTFQEFSQRYADPTQELEFCLREARLQDKKNRQNSIDNMPEHIKGMWYAIQTEDIYKTLAHYKWAVDNGMAKECARVILPEGNTVSRCYMNGSIRSWIHYIQLRTKNGTQKEHVLVAEKCAEAIANVFPLINKITDETLPENKPTS